MDVGRCVDASRRKSSRPHVWPNGCRRHRLRRSPRLLSGRRRRSMRLIDADDLHRLLGVIMEDTGWDELPAGTVSRKLSWSPESGRPCVQVPVGSRAASMRPTELRTELMKLTACAVEDGCSHEDAAWLLEPATPPQGERGGPPQPSKKKKGNTSAGASRCRCGGSCWYQEAVRGR